MFTYIQEPKKIVSLVIAKYQEDVSWLAESPYHIFLYDKSDQPINDSIPLANVGREAETYLYHIIKNYDTLSDFTLFAQANPHPHHTYFLQEVQDFLKNTSNLQQFINFGLPIETCFNDGMPHCEGLPIIDFTQKFNIKIPKRLIFGSGGHFGVGKNLIHLHSKQFYMDLYSSVDDHEFPHLMERLWMYIFCPVM